MSYISTLNRRYLNWKLCLDFINIKMAPLPGVVLLENFKLSQNFAFVSHSDTYLIFSFVLLCSFCRIEEVSKSGSNCERMDFPPLQVMMHMDSILTFKH